MSLITPSKRSTTWDAPTVEPGCATGLTLSLPTLASPRRQAAGSFNRSALGASRGARLPEPGSPTQGTPQFRRAGTGDSMVASPQQSAARQGGGISQSLGSSAADRKVRGDGPPRAKLFPKSHTSPCDITSFLDQSASSMLVAGTPPPTWDRRDTKQLDDEFAELISRTRPQMSQGGAQLPPMVSPRSQPGEASSDFSQRVLQHEEAREAVESRKEETEEAVGGSRLCQSIHRIRTKLKDVSVFREQFDESPAPMYGKAICKAQHVI